MLKLSIIVAYLLATFALPAAMPLKKAAVYTTGNATTANKDISNGKPGNNEVLFQNGMPTGIYINYKEKPVVKTALSILEGDVHKVFNTELKVLTKWTDARIISGTIGQNNEFSSFLKAKKINVSSIQGKWEAFLIQRITDNGVQKLLIAGSDSRGTAYGLLEVSRMIGVSPWEWWADATPEKRDLFLIPQTAIQQSPSVQYRGIFLNDEDWGLNPWSTKTFEPGNFPPGGKLKTNSRFKGAIGPKTYARIFELLLRLRANSIWPAMHEVTIPFYLVEGNREMAEKYDIFIGSSHCEPLARNSATEWDLEGKGDYNYLTNKDNIISYWEDRLKDLGNANNIFTIGMRGKHDGPMQGAKTTEEYKKALEKVIPDQQQQLAKYINPDVSKIPQMLIPYKELLDVYNAGLKVPDYVTLMWCDDNYGYITHFPNEAEQKRSGGNGIYYHASYWGRPHDYLWLGTASPSLLFHQMKLAYDKGARKIWILNVGDIKPVEYQTELFLDMAWNIEAISTMGTRAHLKNWLNREFGQTTGDRLLPIMQEHYRLAYIRKPEFMGNTREEERDPVYKIIKDLPWSEAEINQRLYSYDTLSALAEKIAGQIPAPKQQAYFELVKYPVQAATQMNRKLLYAQLARHQKAGWQLSDAAYDSIVSLTRYYNALNKGKWNNMMDYQPRKLPVFDRVKHTQDEAPLPAYQQALYAFNGADYTTATAKQTILEGLGYQGKAVAVQKGSSISFQLENLDADSVLVEVRLLPSHPVSGNDISFDISINGNLLKKISYKTAGRSEEWKENVLRNQAIRRITVAVNRNKKNTLTLTAEDEGVVIDQVLVTK